MGVIDDRDFIGYAATPPNPKWPGGARLALQIVMNYEEGGERSILHGDDEAESFLQEVVGAPPVRGARNLQVESVYEYGSRVGFWRLMRVFAERSIKISVFAIGMALERHREAAAAIVEAGHEVVSHGWRWIDYQSFDPAVEREHMRLAIKSLTRATGSRPLGWYTGRLSPNTRRLVVEEGGFLYDSDAFAYLRDAFDVLYAEGADRPRMMSVGLHMRLAGRPGRLRGLVRFLDHVARHDRVWICRRDDIARHWIANHPAPASS